MRRLQLQPPAPVKNFTMPKAPPKVTTDSEMDNVMVTHRLMAGLLAKALQCNQTRVFNVLQLRLIPALRELKEELQRQTAKERANICLTYITRRGRWYDVSWKGSPEKSGGVALNILRGDSLLSLPIR